MLNHHSLSLRVQRSVLGFLRGEYLVNSSKKTRRTMYLNGKKAIIKAMNRRATAHFSLAWTQ